MLEKIIYSQNLDDLKKNGSYFEIKKIIENYLNNKLHVKGWQSLFERITFLRKVFFERQEEIRNIFNEKKLSKAKEEIFKIIGIKITAKSRNIFNEKIQKFQNLFLNLNISPYDKYEITKKRNFKNSSKLEGIIINDINKSIDEIIQEYKGVRCG